MEYMSGKDRDSFQMFCLQSAVPSDSFVRIIDLFVDAMPLEDLGFTHTQLNKEGNQPYHPGDLFKLLLYGYRFNLRSSYKLAKACYNNIEVMWLLKELRPSPRTINYFRANNTTAIENAHRHFVKLLKSWKLIDGGLIAVDSTKINAQNSLKNNFNQKKIDRHIKYLEDKFDQVLKELREEEEKNSKKRKPSQKEKDLHNKLKNIVKREDQFGEIQDLINDSEDGQVSLTDPDARSVIKHRNITEVGYSIQTTVDAKHKMVIDVFAGGVNDLNDLGTAVKRTQTILDKKDMDVLADAGYYNGAEIAYVERLGAKPYVSPRAQKYQKEEGFRKIDFIYDASNNTYTCPEGHTMTEILQFKRGNPKRKYTVKRYATNQCATCPVRDQCTTAYHGRYIERPNHQEHVDRNDNRIAKNRDYYRQRQQIIEHVFDDRAFQVRGRNAGHFLASEPQSGWESKKRQWGLGYTLVKTKRRVVNEYNLAALAYNLTRLLSLKGEKWIKTRLKKLDIFLFGPSDSHGTPYSLFNHLCHTFNAMNGSFNRPPEQQFWLAIA